MRLPNHIVGGFCLTGFFSSVFFSINVLASPWMIATVALASIGPDCDNPRSLAGKIVYPVAKWLNRKTGHRTLTHSLVFIAALAIVGSMVEKTFFGSVHFSIVITIAWFVHVLLDTFTLQGVQLMFPFSFEPYWMFDKVESRIRNGDFKAEGAFFLAFTVLTFAQGNLWQNGFWTSYNNSIGTIENLESEMRRSSDALDVVATCKAGSVTLEKRGLLVELKSSGMVLMGEKGFDIIGDDEVFQHATFTHTGKELKIEQQSIIAVPADSLNNILQGKKIKNLEFAANQTFKITEPNGFQKSASNFKADYISQSPLFSEIEATPALDTFIEDRTFQAEIELLQAEIQRLKRANVLAETVQRQQEELIARLRRDYSEKTDISERQRIHDEIKEALSSRREQSRPDSVKIEALKDRIQKIRKENRLKAEAKKQGIELKNQQELAKVQETRFTGILSWIELNKASLDHAEPAQQEKTYRVIGIKDGDTIEAIDEVTKTPFVIRLAHVDCPEKKQAFGQKAKQFTSGFCFGKQISITQTGKDRFGRRICEVFVAGESLNLALVKAGLAWHYKKYSKDGRFDGAEKEARAQQLGLWLDADPTPPWEWRIK